MLFFCGLLFCCLCFGLFRLVGLIWWFVEFVFCFYLGGRLVGSVWVVCRAGLSVGFLFFCGLELCGAVVCSGCWFG